MLIIENPGDGIHLTARISGDNFWRLRDILASQAISRYHRQTKTWFFDLNCLEPILDDVQTMSKYERIHISKGAEDTFNNWKAFIDKRLALKTNSFHLPDIEEYFHADKFPEFQKRCANFLYRNKRAIVGLPTGAGKTPIYLAACAAGITRSQYEKVIFVCEPDGTQKMEKEVHKFLDWKTFRVHGPPKRRYKIYADWIQDPDPGFLIISYATIRGRIIKPQRKNGRRNPDYSQSEVKLLKDAMGSITYAIINDEVQNCKHHNSLQSYAMQYLEKGAEACYGGSATYIEGRLTELYGVFKVTRPDVFGTASRFVGRHVNKGARIEKDKWIRIEEAKKKVAPFVVRFRQDEFDDEGILPKEVYKDYWSTLSTNQRKLYKIIMEEEEKKRQEFLAKKAKRLGKSIDDVSAGVGDNLWRMTRERQCCLFPEILDSNLRGESPKFDLLVKLIDEFDPDEKIIIFCHFIPAVEILLRDLSEYWNTIGIHGDMRVNVEDVKEKYMTDPDVKILVTSDKLQKTHDLNVGRTLINFDVLWNPAWMTQRKGRITRAFGKHPQVLIYTMLTKNTVEQYMFRELIEPKQGMMIDFMDDGIESTHITREVIETVYDGYKG